MALEVALAGDAADGDDDTGGGGDDLTVLPRRLRDDVLSGMSVEVRGAKGGHVMGGRGHGEMGMGTGAQVHACAQGPA